MEALDTLARRAQDGDEIALSDLFESLRVRFLSLAKRRVRPDDCQDLVQEALRIVHEKLLTKDANVGVLPWSYLILRNVIGNYYQAERAGKERRIDLEVVEHTRSDEVPEDPLDQLSLEESVREVAVGLRTLAMSHPSCAELFERILELWKSDEEPERWTEKLLEERPATTRNALYVTLHRCRARLKKILGEGRGTDDE